MLFHRNHDHGRMDLFGDTAAILNSIVSNSYDGMLRVKHPIIAIETIEFKMVIQTKVARISKCFPSTIKRESRPANSNSSDLKTK